MQDLLRLAAPCGEADSFDRLTSDEASSKDLPIKFGWSRQPEGTINEQ